MMPPPPPPSILLFRPTVEMLHFSRRYFFWASKRVSARGRWRRRPLRRLWPCVFPPSRGECTFVYAQCGSGGTPVRPVRRTVARRTHSPRSQELLPPSPSTQMGRTMGELREGGGKDRTVVGRGSEKRKRPRTSEMGKGRRRRGDELTRHFVFRGRAAARGGGRKEATCTARRGEERGEKGALREGGGET